MQITINIIPINGIDYITVKDMARITNRSNQTVYNLINKGNVIRKMKNIKISEKTLIPYSEVFEFPFTYAGVNAKDNIYHYNSDGIIVNVEKKECCICGAQEGKIKNVLNKYYCWTCYEEFGKEEKRERNIYDG